MIVRRPMSVIEPRELEESPLADLHAIASELGIESYRRLRREALIAAIIESQGGTPTTEPAQATDAAAAADEPAGAASEDQAPAPRRRAPRRRTGRRPAAAEAPAPAGEQADALARAADELDAPAAAAEEADAPAFDDEKVEEHAAVEPEPEAEVRAGVLDVLPNGSGFLRGGELSQGRDDVYVSPSQIRRCELRTGDDVAGPIRSPRRSERHPSLVHVETVNGAPPEPPAERPRFEDLTPVYATERLSAPEGLDAVPFGKGSRVAIGGPPGAGATALLRAIVATLADRHADLQVAVVLASARPEEATEWRRAVTEGVVGGSFDESTDRQLEAATMAVERAKRSAERGADAVVVIDALDALPPQAARRVFGAGRNTEEAGSVTVVAAAGLAAEPQRLATTRIVLEATGSGTQAAAPALLAEASGTLRADLLAG